MSSLKYASPLVLKPRTSNIFVSVYAVVYLGAMIVVLPLTWHWGLKAVLLFVLLLSMVYTLKQKGLGEITLLTWKEGGDWVIEFKDGTTYETQLLPSTYVSPLLVVLNFRATEDKQKRSITLFRDALDSERFRQLRVRLNLDGTGKE